MNPRMLHESVMLNIARSLAHPERLRPIVERYPETAFFAARFEAVEADLRAAQDDVDAERREKVDEVKGTRSSLENLHDRIVRQMFFCLEMHQQAEDEELVELAERLGPILLPNGRTLTRYGVSRKIGEAHNVDERLDPPERRDLMRLRAAEGHGLDLHERRMEVVAQLERVQDRLNAFNGEEVERGAQLTEARASFVQLISAFRTTLGVAAIGDEDKHQLLAQLEIELERVNARRARAERRGLEEGAADLNLDVESPSVDAPVADGRVSEVPAAAEPAPAGSEAVTPNGASRSEGPAPAPLNPSGLEGPALVPLNPS